MTRTLDSMLNSLCCDSPARITKRNGAKNPSMLSALSQIREPTMPEHRKPVLRNLPAIYQSLQLQRKSPISKPTLRSDTEQTLRLQNSPQATLPAQLDADSTTKLDSYFDAEIEKHVIPVQIVASPSRKPSRQRKEAQRCPN